MPDLLDSQLSYPFHKGAGREVGIKTLTFCRWPFRRANEERLKGVKTQLKTLHNPTKPANSVSIARFRAVKGERVPALLFESVNLP